jgi:hypothetical protein
MFWEATIFMLCRQGQAHGHFVEKNSFPFGCACAALVPQDGWRHLVPIRIVF